MFFQQEVAKLHYKASVHAYLDEVFQARWINVMMTIKWIASSPDLSPLD